MRSRIGTGSSLSSMHAPDHRRRARPAGRRLEIARGFFVLGERLDIDWLEQAREAGRHPVAAVGAAVDGGRPVRVTPQAV
jgi:hypothetical protein